MILSIANRCSLVQQQYATKCLVTSLGDKLYTQPLDDERQQLPSPDELRGKVLIKVRVNHGVGCSCMTGAHTGPQCQAMGTYCAPVR